MDFSELYTYQVVHTENPHLLKTNSESLSRTLQEVSFPDSGGGIGFNPSNARDSCFVIWRSRGDILELHELATSSTATGSALTIQFTGSAIVDCRIVKSSSYLEFLVCTSNGCARISFWCNDNRENTNPWSPTLHDAPDWFRFYQIKGLQPNLIQTATSSFCESAGDAYFVYGLSSGAVLVARARFGVDECVEVFELHHASMIQKLWSGIIPFSKIDCDSLTTSIQLTPVSFDDVEELVASICKDHRLRLWDLKRRNCYVTLDLLEFLPEHRDFVADDALRSSLSPGLYHRIKQYQPNSDSSPCSSVGLLVYLALSHSTTTDRTELVGNNIAYSAGYWCWLLLDLTRARARDRDPLQVVSVERIVKFGNSECPPFSPDDCLDWNDLGTNEVNVLDFLPICMDRAQLWTRRRQFRSRGYDGKPQPGDRADGSKLQGIWWLAHQSTNLHATLVDRYSLQWSATRTHHDGHEVISHGCALSPGLHPIDLLPNWRRQPPWLMTQTSGQLLDDLDDSSFRPSAEDIDAFVEFMFQPYRLSWFAISNALKSLCDGNHLPNIGNLVPSRNMDDLRLQVHQTLMDGLIISSTSNDPVSVLRTFYSAAMDYHEYGLQPLGLFEIPFVSSLLQLDSEVCLPYTPGLVVVRRFGFSVLRPMDPHERLLWNTIPDRPLFTPSALRSSSATNASSPVVSQLSARVRLLLQHLHQHSSWNQWNSTLSGVSSSSLNNCSDSCDISKLTENILLQFDERSTILDTTLFSDPTDWKRFVFANGLDSVEHVMAFDKLTLLLENQSNDSVLDSDGCMSGALSDLSDRQLSDERKNHRLSRLNVELLCQAFSQSCCTRMEFAFGLLLLATRHMLNPLDCGSLPSSEESVSFANVVCRLTRLVHSLRLLRWLSCVRTPPVSDSKKFAITSEQLAILGFSHANGISKFPPGPISYSTSQVTHIPGLTLLEQLCVEFPDLPTSSSSDERTTNSPWMLQFVTSAGRLYTTLNPATRSGKSMLRVLRHLLSGGDATELLTLGGFLCASAPVDSLGIQQQHSTQEFHALPSTSWVGDLSALYLCMGLARLWLGQPKAAEDYFIKASIWLKEYVRSSLNLQAEETDFPFATSKHPTLSDLFLGPLFPGEFNNSSLFGLRDFEDASIDVICPEEIQVRFLTKIMPVLEAADCAEQVLNLSELALNVLASVRKYTEPNECDSGTKSNAESYRLGAILDNTFTPLDGHGEGFLCNPASVDVFNGTTPRSQLYARLADLEAALWTRMFKHRLAAGHYALAHQLIRSNPDRARRRDCLRQLIVTLCDRGEASQLISLHYGASEDEFLLILEARARSTDVLPACMPSSIEDTTINVNPYYDVLYAFHIERANYRAAAMILYEHAHRLAEETACSAFSLASAGFRASGARLLFGLQRQTACLVSAINALYLVPEEHRFIIRPWSSVLDGVCPTAAELSDVMDEGEEQQSDTDTALEIIVEDNWAFEEPSEQVFKLEDDAGEATNHSAPCNLAVKKDSPVSYNSRLTQVTQDKHILQLPDLIRLYTLARARLRLAQVCWEQGMLRAGPASPEEVVQSLLTLALYDEAVRVVELFDLSRIPIVDAVAARCAELAQHMAVNPTSTVLRDVHSNFELGVNGSISPLPGLSKIPSPLAHEGDLVIQSINNLTGSVSLGQLAALSRTERISTTGLRALALGDLYWRLLEVILSRLDPSTTVAAKKSNSKQAHAFSGGHLLLLACRHLLGSGPTQLHLPEWIVSRLLSSTTDTSRPIGLLRLYLQYDRIETAYHLIMDMLDAARGTGSDPSAFGLQASLDDPKHNTTSHRSLSHSSGTQPLLIPHVLIVCLLQALQSLSAEFPAFQAMHNNLSQNVAKYFECLSAACLKLAA